MNMDINIDDREIDIDEGFYVDLFDNCCQTMISVTFLLNDINII